MSQATVACTILFEFPQNETCESVVALVYNNAPLRGW